MSIQSVLLPVFVELLLIFVLLGAMAKLRQDAFAAGVRPRDVMLGSDAFPPRARQVANSFANQFEIPVLFFLAVIFGWVLHQTGWLFVLLEWVFVVFRLAHAGVHVTTNRVPVRGALFIGSVAATALMWLLIFIGTFFGKLIY